MLAGTLGFEAKGKRACCFELAKFEVPKGSPAGCSGPGKEFVGAAGNPTKEACVG